MVRSNLRSKRNSSSEESEVEDSAGSDKNDGVRTKSPSKESSKIIRIPGETLAIFVSKEEELLRKKSYPDVEQIKHDKLTCTVCDKIIGPRILRGLGCDIHSALGVLVCKDCLNFYGDGNFSVDSDGDEKYCRWCAQGGNLFLCDKCNCSFCKRCVKKNLSRDMLKKMEESDNWECFICKPEPLYELRAQAWAANEVYLKETKGTKHKTKKKHSSGKPNQDSDGSDYEPQRKGRKSRKSNRKDSSSSTEEDNKKKSNQEKMKTKRRCGNKDNSLGRSSETSTLSETDSERKCLKVGIRFLNDIMKDFSDFSKELVSRTTKIQEKYISKSVIKSTDDVFKTSKKIESFFSNFEENIEDFRERLKDSSEAFRNIINSTLNSSQEVPVNSNSCNNVVVEKENSRKSEENLLDKEEDNKSCSENEMSCKINSEVENKEFKKSNLKENVNNGNKKIVKNMEKEPEMSPSSDASVRDSSEEDKVKNKKEKKAKKNVQGSDTDIKCDEDEGLKEKEKTKNPVSDFDKESSKIDNFEEKEKAGKPVSKKEKAGKPVSDSENKECNSDDDKEKSSKTKDTNKCKEDHIKSSTKIIIKDGERAVNNNTVSADDVSDEDRDCDIEVVVNDSDEDKSVDKEINENKEKSKTGSESDGEHNETVCENNVDEGDILNEAVKNDLLASSDSDLDNTNVSNKGLAGDSSIASSIDLDSDNEDCSTSRKKKKKLTKRVKKNESNKKLLDKSSASKKENKKNEDDEDTDDEIRRLANLQSLKRKRKASSDNDESEENDDDINKINSDKENNEVKKKQKTEKKNDENHSKRQKKSILDSLKDGSDSDENEGSGHEELGGDDDFDIFSSNFMKDVKKNSLTENDMIKQIMVMSSSSSSSSSDLDSEGCKLLSKIEERSKKKKSLKKDIKMEEDGNSKIIKNNEEDLKDDDESNEAEQIDEEKSKDIDVNGKKIKEEESGKVKQESDDDKIKKENGEASKDDSGSDSEDIFIKKPKSNWRKNKLLVGKLSDTDSTDEEDRKEKWKKQFGDRKTEKKDDNTESSFSESDKKKKKRKKPNKRIVCSDSDELKVSLSSDSSSSVQEIGKSKSKKRKKGSSSSVVSISSDEKNSKKKRKRIKAPVESSSESDKDDNENADNSQSQGKDSKGRKNIRKVMKDDSLAEATRSAAKDEEERRQRISERQRLYNKIYEIKEVEPGKIEKLVLDFDPVTKKELVVVDNELVSKMKPHQANGVKFMWESCYESVEQLKKGVGSGCILAHCMGLGKTFQVVSLVHTLLTHEETNVKKVLVVCPLSTVLNWHAEFEFWLKDVGSGQDVELFHLSKDKQIFARAYRMQDWYSTGGVMIIGYEMFRILTNETAKNIKKKQKEIFKSTLLDPGPDLVICDEGHMLKNENTALSKAMNKLKTLRRIVLTGTPLQNNLVEYHCMVNFVKPNLLGSRKEFCNRFVNPITNGQFVDSTERDFKIMKRRAHVLHKMLEGLVQRCDYNVLTPYLPPKQEYVLSIRLTEIQAKLYRLFLENVANKGSRVTLLADFQGLSRIWSHPLALKIRHEKELEKRMKEDTDDSEGSLKDFVVDNSDDSSTSLSKSSSDSDESVSILDADKPKKRMTRAVKKELGVEDEPEVVLQEPEVANSAWWNGVLEKEHFESITSSSKLILLFAILRECELIGDKVLIFSQSLYSLNLIEYFLEKIDDATQKGKNDSKMLDDHSSSWVKGLDYFRLDGSSSTENRSIWIKHFNKEKNTRARLFLISTRAGGLGINLTAANRVIIFDASWNPSYDVQSIFRIYRFGQNKPCYIYRFIAQGTMEEKVYERQVAKLSLSQRVVDEQQVNRYFSHSDLQELYAFTPAEKKDDSIPMLPKDRLMADMLQQYSEWIYKCHEHDSLLDHVEEEELNEEERKAAWEDYENEKKRGYALPAPNANAQRFMMPNDIKSTLSMVQSVREAIKQKYKHFSPSQRLEVEKIFMKSVFKEQPQQYQIYLQAVTQQQFLQQQQNYLLLQQQQQQQQIPYINQLQRLASEANAKTSSLSSGMQTVVPTVARMTSEANAASSSVSSGPQTGVPTVANVMADSIRQHMATSFETAVTSSNSAGSALKYLSSNPASESNNQNDN